MSKLSLKKELLLIDSHPPQTDGLTARFYESVVTKKIAPLDLFISNDKNQFYWICQTRQMKSNCE